MTIDPQIVATHDQHLAIVRDHLATLNADDLRDILAQWRKWMTSSDVDVATFAIFAVLGLTTAYLSVTELERD